MAKWYINVPDFYESDTEVASMISNQKSIRNACEKQMLLFINRAGTATLEHCAAIYHLHYDLHRGAIMRYDRISQMLAKLESRDLIECLYGSDGMVKEARAK